MYICTSYICTPEDSTWVVVQPQAQGFASQVRLSSGLRVGVGVRVRVKGEGVGEGERGGVGEGEGSSDGWAQG